MLIRLNIITVLLLAAAVSVAATRNIEYHQKILIKYPFCYIWTKVKSTAKFPFVLRMLLWFVLVLLKIKFELSDIAN